MQRLRVAEPGLTPIAPTIVGLGCAAGWHGSIQPHRATGCLLPVPMSLAASSHPWDLIWSVPSPCNLALLRPDKISSGGERKMTPWPVSVGGLTSPKAIMAASVGEPRMQH